jgi:hypothetical protein
MLSVTGWVLVTLVVTVTSQTSEIYLRHSWGKSVDLVEGCARNFFTVCTSFEFIAFISVRPYQLNVVSNIIVEYISPILCQIQALTVER